MKTVWAGVFTICLILIGFSVSRSSAESEERSLDEDNILPPWWNSVFGVKPRSLRADRGKDERFWATRGKRSGLSIKPNGLFQPIKWKKASTLLKPNGFFMMGKRSSFKPNSLFSMTRGKRSFMKPNGLFSPLENYGGKRSISLKPNGLFSLTKRSDPSMVEADPTVSMSLYDQFWGMPMGIFGAYKKRSLDYDEFEEEENMEDVIEDEYDYDFDTNPVKREASTFWATRGKKDGNMFWATRGKRGENFWAVRG